MTMEDVHFDCEDGEDDASQGADTSSPFHRTSSSKSISREYLNEQLRQTMSSLKKPMKEGDDAADENVIYASMETMTLVWRKRNMASEIAFRGLLALLEYCLTHPYDGYPIFEHFINSLGYNTVQFWRYAVPYIFDSDLSNGTKFRDALLFSMTLYDINTGRSRLRELYAAVPGIRNSLLGVHAKRFGEIYHHLQQRMSRHGSLASLNSEDENSECWSPRRSNHASESEGEEPNRVSSGGLANSHYHQRVINVSNAPPVSLKREKSGDWEIKQGSGGLVACVDPVMSKDHENLWLANLGMNMKEGNRSSSDLSPATNTLGLPLIKQAIAEVFFHVLADEKELERESSQEREQRKAREDMSLLGVLNTYNRGSYKLNPVIVQEDDYNVYYGGISNGLLWPALHNLPEYIVKEYIDPKILKDHWCAYVRVNYQFAIDAVRNSRPQDFIWIHDYHLMLTGMIMQSLDPHLEVGFFLHIPFQPPDDFFTKYGLCALPVLRGLLRFTKVGFQTHRDRAKYVELVKKHMKGVVVGYDQQLDIYTVVHEGWTCSLGVFPVSIKNDDFLKFVPLPETKKLKEEFRKKRPVEDRLAEQEGSSGGEWRAGGGEPSTVKPRAPKAPIMGDNPTTEGRFFFSVERFDYTKGIKEKLMAYERYYEKYPDRIGKDVLYQIAVTNRRSVDTYRQYQDDCMELAENINKRFAKDDWKPLIFQTDGLPRNELVAAYLAMDVGIVTPKKDGMNLVAKEMLVCNPMAGLVLSTGAGSEIQFNTAGLHKEDGEKNYHRVEDLFDKESYADSLYEAATESEEERAKHGKTLHEFIVANDIERWSSAFLDPRWTHHVIRPTEVDTLDDFFSLMMRTTYVRRQIVDRVLKGIPIRSHFAISLRNAKESLENSCKANSHTLLLKSNDDSPTTIRFDIQNELTEFDKDLSFIRYIQSEDPDNIEQFVETLPGSTSVSEEQFKKEVQQAVQLLYDADHFHYFFTDRDGTLKSYSCSYPSSIQPAYSGVIQAQFARRCAQTCCILTTAPLMHIGVLDVCTIPPGYYYYGASGGREWFIDPSNKFKDTSIPDAHLATLDRVFSEISKLLETDEFKPFTWIGSGLQKHYGHLTIAHQDIYGSVKEEKGEALLEKIKKIVKKEEILQLKITELDIKIMLVENSGEVFDKGNGIRLLCEKMKCNLKEGSILVCGDSDTDLPMLRECLKQNPEGVSTIWVTSEQSLKDKVRSLCSEYGNNHVAFVSCPEVLLGAMAQATIREISVARPHSYETNGQDSPQ